MATPEEQVKLAAFLLQHGKEDGAKKVLESLANAEPETKEASNKPYLYLDPDLGVQLHNWHWGQNDPIYAVGSQIAAGKKVMKKHLQEAIDELDRIYERDRRHRQLKPSDRRDLEELLDTLNGYMSGDIEDYSYAFEGEDD